MTLSIQTYCKCTVMVLLLALISLYCNAVDGSKTHTIAPQNAHIFPLNFKSNNLSSSVSGRNVSFAFKGLGLSISKSLRTAKTFGISIKLPLTSHFPIYDKLKYLPRFGSSFGVNWFPFDYKCTISMSLPFMTAAYGAGSILQQVGIIQKTDDNFDFTDKYMHSDDSIRRIGLSVSFKYNFIKGFRLTFGPWANCQAGQRVVDTLLPSILLIPTITMVMVNLVRMIVSVICKLAIRTISWIRQQSQVSRNSINDITTIANATHIASSSKSDHLKQHHQQHPLTSNQQHAHKKNEVPLLPLVQPLVQPTIKHYKSKLNLKFNQYHQHHNKTKQPKLTIQQKLSLKRWHKKLMEYVSKKGPKIAAGLGIFVPYKTTPRIVQTDYYSIGSYVRFEIKNIYIFTHQIQQVLQFLLTQHEKVIVFLDDTYDLLNETFTFAVAKWNNRQPSPSTRLQPQPGTDENSTAVVSVLESESSSVDNNNSGSTIIDDNISSTHKGDNNDTVLTTRRPVLKKKPHGTKKTKHTSSNYSASSSPSTSKAQM